MATETIWPLGMPLRQGFSPYLSMALKTVLLDFDRLVVGIHRDQRIPIFGGRQQRNPDHYRRGK